ncbi:MAG TPA: hypothetical protein VF172_13735 [Nitrososphaera sp.]
MAALRIIVLSLPVLVALALMPYAYSQSSPEITNMQCPEKLYVGERGKVSATIENGSDQEMLILNSTFAIDGNEKDGLLPLEGNRFPLVIPPDSRVSQSVLARFDNEGYHYVDLVLGYALAEESSKKVQLCEIQVITVGTPKDALGGALNSFQTSPLISVLVLAPLGGFIAFILQRQFSKKDFESQQKIQHRTWLLQTLHSLANKYYIPLSKFGFEAHRAIDLAAVSKDDEGIKKAYYYFSIFIAKFTEFEREAGANYLFLQRQEEQRAIGLHQAIGVLSPINQDDINTITKTIIIKDGETTSLPDYDSRAFQSFSNWIKSDHCGRSRSWMIRQLRTYSLLLDRQGERISQPDYFMSTAAETPEAKGGNEEFWITHHTPFYVKKNEGVVVQGHGFKNQNITYTFKIGELTPQIEVISDEALKVIIPQEIAKGAYDIYATFRADDIGIVVHVLNS